MIFKKLAANMLNRWVYSNSSLNTRLFARLDLSTSKSRRFFEESSSSVFSIRFSRLRVSLSAIALNI